jgi:hypothetical protein
MFRNSFCSSKVPRTWCMKGCLLFGIGLVSGLIIFKSLQRVAPATSYVYSPGLFGSPVVIGRYCPYYVAPTGEEIYGTRGGKVLGDGTKITAVVFPEIDVDRSNSWFRRIIYPMVSRKVLFSLFGIIVKDEGSSATSFSNYMPTITRANIGQEADIETLRKHLTDHCSTYPDTKVVMYGDSRGAATTFNVIALDHHPQIACAVLEGIFDSIPHLIKHCWRWKSKYDCIESFIHSMLRICASCYTQDGPFPIDYAEKIPLDIPLLLVTSVRDEIVPYQSTIRLYCRLKERGCKNVHLLVLKYSNHKGYMVGKDRSMYESCVHAFYRAYGVDYDEKLAVVGASFFLATQPTVTDVREKYGLHATCCY